MIIGNKIPVGRIAGVPVALDYSFILLVILYGHSYFTSGSSRLMLIGVGVVIGGIGSILVHELAHAWAGRICRTEPTHIELNGMGGLCFFGRSAATAREDVFITLAGPASNLALWALFHWLGDWTSWSISGLFDDENASEIATHAGFVAASHAMTLFAILASLNVSLFVFNMLPSFPLDGGRALANALSRRMDHLSAQKLVAQLGLAVCAFCVWYAVKGNIFMLVMAFHLFLANREMLDRAGNPPWQRWN